MPWFKCFIEGKNFPGVLMQQGGLLGFFSTRAVEAESVEGAETKALESLRADRSFALPAGATPSEDARVYFESIIEVDESETMLIPNAGATWYPMDEEEG